MDCYRAAIRNVAFYAIELDKEITAAYRLALSRLEGEADAAKPEALPILLRDYRGEALAYASRLADSLHETARNLAQILDSLADGDGDYDSRMRNALVRLRDFARSPDAGLIGEPLLAAAAGVQEAIDQMRQRQETAVSQLMDEIHSLHKRIDSLESTASLDVLSSLLSRVEMEKRLQAAAGRERVLLLGTSGLLLAETRFDSHVAAQLAAALLKRLQRILPEGCAVGRWSEEEFVLAMPDSPEAPMWTEKLLEEQLSGSYGCSQEGKSVRPTLQVKVTALEAQHAI